MKFIPPRPADLPVKEAYDGSEFHADMSKGSVVFESRLKEGSSFGPAIEELNSPECRTAAIGVANRLGMANACLTGMSDTIYPVNKTGIPLDMVKDGDGNPLDPHHPDAQVHAYRKRILVQKKFI